MYNSKSSDSNPDAWGRLKQSCVYTHIYIYITEFKGGKHLPPGAAVRP